MDRCGGVARSRTRRPWRGGSNFRAPSGVGAGPRPPGRSGRTAPGKFRKPTRREIGRLETIFKSGRGRGARQFTRSAAPAACRHRVASRRDVYERSALQNARQSSRNMPEDNTPPPGDFTPSHAPPPVHPSVSSRRGFAKTQTTSPSAPAAHERPSSRSLYSTGSNLSASSEDQVGLVYVEDSNAGARLSSPRPSSVDRPSTISEAYPRAARIRLRRATPRPRRGSSGGFRDRDVDSPWSDAAAATRTRLRDASSRRRRGWGRWIVRGVTPRLGTVDRPWRNVAAGDADVRGRRLRYALEDAPSGTVDDGEAFDETDVLLEEEPLEEDYAATRASAVQRDSRARIRRAPSRCSAPGRGDVVLATPSKFRRRSDPAAAASQIVPGRVAALPRRAGSSVDGSRPRRGRDIVRGQVAAPRAGSFADGSRPPRRAGSSADESPRPRALDRPRTDRRGGRPPSSRRAAASPRPRLSRAIDLCAGATGSSWTSARASPPRGRRTSSRSASQARPRKNERLS